MTNTLHRFGPAESFQDDYVVFAMASKGRNDKGSLPRLKLLVYPRPLTRDVPISHTQSP